MVDTLKEVLQQPGQRARILTDCEAVLDEEVASKGGLSGLPIKAGFKVLKGVKPGVIREACDYLLDEFVEKLEPFFAAWKTQGGGRSLSDYFTSRAGEIADGLLSITDAKAVKAKSGPVKGAYEQLRPMAKKHTEAAIPRVARMLEKYVR